MPPKIGGRNRSENVGRSRETKMLGVETYDIMAFFTCVCKTRQDKTMFYLESYTVLCISTLSK